MKKTTLKNRLKTNRKNTLTGNINELCKESHAISLEKGWYDKGDRNIGELLMLVTSELVEALEEVRNGWNPKAIYYSGEGSASKEQSEKHPKPEGFPVELADAVIRIADLCGYLGIDLEEAIRIKTEYNKTRPSRHGGKKF